MKQVQGFRRRELGLETCQPSVFSPTWWSRSEIEASGVRKCGCGYAGPHTVIQEDEDSPINYAGDFPDGPSFSAASTIPLSLRLHPREYHLGPSHSPSAVTCWVTLAWPTANRRHCRSFSRRLSSWLITWWKCTSRMVEATNQWRGQMRSRYAAAWHHCRTAGPASCADAPDGLLLPLQ